MRRTRRLEIVLAAIVATALEGLGVAGGRTRTPLGSVVSIGSVWVDNQPAPSRASVFEGDVVVTGESSKAILEFRSGAAAELGATSELALASGGAPVNLALRHGVVSIRNAGPQSVRVRVHGATVLLREQGRDPVIGAIASLANAAAVFADRGQVEIQSPRARFTLTPGKFAEFNEGTVPQGSGESLGRVGEVVPDVVVQHPPDISEVFLRREELVGRNDVIRTLQFGRVRVEFFGGSAFNLGSLSTLRIVSHDAESQQTQVELLAGRLSGETVQPARASAAFQVLTEKAAVKALGRFVIDERPRDTLVCAVEGTASVRNARSAIAGEVALRGGECTSVAPAQPPTKPLQAAEAIRREMARTALVEMPAWKQGVVKSMPTSTYAAAAGAQLVSVGLSGWAIKRLRYANGAIGGAQDWFTDLNPHNVWLPGAVQGETNAFQSLCNATLDFEQKVVSPSTPPSGCQ